jgi:hypothetical protein
MQLPDHLPLCSADRKAAKWVRRSGAIDAALTNIGAQLGDRLNGYRRRFPPRLTHAFPSFLIA